MNSSPETFKADFVCLKCCLTAYWSSSLAMHDIVIKTTSTARNDMQRAGIFQSLLLNNISIRIFSGIGNSFISKEIRRTQARRHLKPILYAWNAVWSLIDHHQWQCTMKSLRQPQQRRNDMQSAGNVKNLLLNNISICIFSGIGNSFASKEIRWTQAQRCLKCCLIAYWSSSMVMHNEVITTTSTAKKWYAEYG